MGLTGKTYADLITKKNTSIPGLSPRRKRNSKKKKKVRKK